MANQYCTKYHANYNFFDVIDSEEKAYWLGFIAADGTVPKVREPNSFCVNIRLANKDFHHLEKFKKNLNSNHIVRTRKVTKVGLVNGTFDVAEYCVYNTQLAKSILNYNIRPKGSMRMPNLEDNTRHFIRGYFDGDGSFSFGEKIQTSFVAESKQFLEDIQLHFKEKLVV
ncbi:MAG: LAGLIDADG family homing endonuclease [Nanoarchaeota archaeon]